MKKALIVIIVISVLLFSGFSVIPALAQAHHSNTQHLFKPVDEPIAYDIHYFNQGDAKFMMEHIKDIQTGNLKAGGYYTGFKTPSRHTIENSVGKLMVVNSVYAPRGFPSTLDLSKDPRFPKVGNQGAQGSCAAWAVTYYSEGWLQAYTHNWTDAHYGYNKHHLMSPAWTYNKVNGGSDSGSSFIANMLVLYRLGGATMYTMPYNDHDAVSWGDEAAWREAPLYRILDGYELNVSAIINATTGTDKAPTPQQVENLTNAIKAVLAEGYTVNFAIDADQYDPIFNNGGNYIISYSEYNANGSINHAQTIVGWNDTIKDNGDQGAFKIVNSWGSGWGKGGYYWITYKAMYKILAMGAGYPWAFYMTPRHNYQPKLLATWNVDPNHPGTRITPIDLGIGSPSHPIQIKRSIFGNITSYNGGDHPFPTFLAVDLTDFIGNFSYNSSNEFFLYAHKWSKKMIITSFHIEYYPNKYIPGKPYQVSDNSPDVPALQDSSHDAIVRAYLRPIQPFHTIKINSNSDFTASNGVIGGNGTKDNPYIIGWWDIDANGSSYAISITNTTAYFIIEKCYLHNTSSGYGIGLHNVQNGYIMKNKIYNNYYGVFFYASYHNTLASNQFFNNTHPVYVSSYPKALYYNQTIYSNNTVGGKPLYYINNKDGYTLANVDAGYIGVFYSTNVTLNNVTIDSVGELFIERSSNVEVLYSMVNSSYWGVTIRYSNSIKVFGSYFTNNIFGIVMYSVKNSVINNNTFSHNRYGLRVSSSYNNTIYHNNFMNNKYQAYDNENNTWSLAPPVGGNYWSDYNGTDANHDGFGDTPYVIPGGSAKDYYPLVKSWDAVPPKVSISSPTNGKILATSSITVYWNGTDNIGISHYQVKLDDGNWINVGNATKYTFNNVKDGQHTVYVEAFDFSNNSAIAQVSFEVDTTPPQIQFISPKENSYVNTSNVLIKWTYSDESKVIFMITIDKNLPMPVGSNTQYLAQGLKSGKHEVTLIGMDAAGNKRTVYLNFSIDTIPPTVQWNMSIQSGSWINTNTITLKWVASDNVAVNYSEIQLDGGNWNNIGNVNEYTFTNLSNGLHNVVLRVYDKAGNYNQTSFSFKVDTKAPTLNITAPENNMITNSSSITVKWSGSDNFAIAYYEIKVDNGTWKNVGNSTSYNLNLEDGQHTIYVKAVDEAGNSKEKSIEITVDTQAPTIEITSPTENYNTTNNYVVVSWSGSDNLGIAYYEIKIDNGSWTKVETQTSYNFTGLSVGQHTVIIKAVDKAGNSNTATITFQIKEVKHTTPTTPGSMSGLVIGLSILVIIIIIIVIAVAMVKKGKKPREVREKEMEKEENSEETEEGSSEEALEE
ncbi:Papain family cysteine protease, putative [Aciduliprofundum boonei T469]|nr:Papain family cysteine protease, putative [Aciduliprofundum boonei T469]